MSDTSLIIILSSIIVVTILVVIIKLVFSVRLYLAEKSLLRDFEPHQKKLKAQLDKQQINLQEVMAMIGTEIGDMQKEFAKNAFNTKGGLHDKAKKVQEKKIAKIKAKKTQKQKDKDSNKGASDS